MLSLIIFGISIGVCIWGIILIAQGLRQKIDEFEAVPISNITEMNNLAKQEKKGLKISSVPVEKDAEEDRVEETVSAEQNQAEVEIKEKAGEQVIERLEEKMIEQERIFKEKLVVLEKRNEDLEKALEREISNKGGGEDSQEAGQLNEEVLEQFKMAEMAVESLTEENERVKGEKNQLTAQNALLAEQIDKIEAEKSQQENERNRVQEQLDGRVKEIEAANEQVRSNAQAVEKLKVELAELSGKDSEYIKKVMLLEHQVEQLKNSPSSAVEMDEEKEIRFKKDVQDLRLQLSQLEEKGGRLREDLEKKERILTDKLDYANETIRILKSEKENPANDQNQIGELLSKHEDGSMFPIVDLKNENNRLLQDKVELEKHYGDLKEFNNRLVEKERILHYELTKSRAQNLGLEKICEEFKIQIESGD